MSAMTFALVLLGCSDAGDDCQALQAAQAAYATRAACTAGIEQAVMSDFAMRADYPVVTAKCVARLAKAEPRKSSIQTHMAIRTAR